MSEAAVEGSGTAPWIPYDQLRSLELDANAGVWRSLDIPAELKLTSVTAPRMVRPSSVPEVASAAPESASDAPENGSDERRHDREAKRGAAIELNAHERSVVAVFDLEDRGVGLDAAVLQRLSDYLAARVASTPARRIVPRGELSARILEAKRSSYRTCYDEACQIEIGKELAAEESLSSMLARLGERCVLTAVLYALERSASVGGASASGVCSETAYVELIDDVVRQLPVPRHEQ